MAVKFRSHNAGAGDGSLQANENAHFSLRGWGSLEVTRDATAARRISSVLDPDSKGRTTRIRFWPLQLAFPSLDVQSLGY